MKRRVLKLTGIAAAGGAVALAVAHLAIGIGLPDNVRESRAQLQQLAWTGPGQSTDSQGWEAIERLRGQVCTNTPVAADVSLALSGGPAEVRVLRQGVRESRPPLSKPLRPGPVEVDPTTGSPFSFTFIDPSQGRGFLHYEVQWRSPTGAEVELDRGTAAYSFGRGPRMACPSAAR